MSDLIERAHTFRRFDVWPTTLVFVSLTHVNIRDNNLFLSTRAHEAAQAALRMGIDIAVGTVWLVVVVGLVFWKYGSSVFG